jgi:hypothetical protein
MTTIEANVRAALMPAIERDLRRRRRPAWMLAASTLVIAVTATTGAAATGLIFAPPKPDRTVPAVPEWTTRRTRSGAATGRSCCDTARRRCSA